MLLDRMRDDAEASGVHPLRIEAPEDRSLPALLAPRLRVPEAQPAAPITAMHRCAPRQVPVRLVGAGLPQLHGRMGNAKSDAERLFESTEIGPLSADAAVQV